MARGSKTRPPYERWGVSREQVEKDYPEERLGWDC